MSKNFIINNLVNSLQRLPSIGNRSAKRIALNILQNKDTVIKPLIDSLKQAYDNIQECEICGNLTTGRICEICSNYSRNEHTICIVESIADLWAIENTNVFNGKYHILNGTLSAIEGRGVEVLKLDKLLERLQKQTVKEIVIATNPTIDGQTTAHYISNYLLELGLKLDITQLAYGVPMGSELNFLDDNTLNIAFKNKKTI